VCSKIKAEHTAKTDHEYKRNTRLPHSRGWHSFRRGLATNLNRLGVNDKVIQLILRHANVSTTQMCYIKPISAGAQNAMEKLENFLTDTNLTPKAAKLGKLVRM
jgi:site-specific recombinase XerD